MLLRWRALDPSLLPTLAPRTSSNTEGMFLTVSCTSVNLSTDVPYCVMYINNTYLLMFLTAPLIFYSEWLEVGTFLKIL